MFHNRRKILAADPERSPSSLWLAPQHSLILGRHQYRVSVAADQICFLATEVFAGNLDCLHVEALDQGGCKIELVVYGHSPHEVQARLACTGIKLCQQRKSMLDFGAEFFTCPAIIADSEFGLCL